MHHKKDEMKSLTFDQPSLVEAADTNNNKKGEKYSLRQRQRRQSSRNKTQNDATPTISDSRKSKQKSKSKAAPLSKYRRKTANARERTRMREINSAFENLRKCVPLSISSGIPTTTNEKLTKITTLKLAMKYIRTLNDVLSKPSSEASFVINNAINYNNNNFNLKNNNNNTNNAKDIFSEILFDANSLTKSNSKRTSAKIQPKGRTKCFNNHFNVKKIQLSPCLSPPMDSPMDLGLMLESDGESLNLSEPCLSPLSQNIKSFSCTANSALEFGILLESDNDSLQLSEPCLSPLGGLDSLNPFSDLLHTGFSEQSSLDMYLT